MDASNTSTTEEKEDWGKYVSLHRAILRADWEKAHEIISKDKDALSAEIDVSGDTALHFAIGVAVGTPEIDCFVENLLKEMNPESLSTLLTNSKDNPLHRAALVGNTKAAKMLVDLNPHLLFCFNNGKTLPIHLATYNSQKATFIYLLGACKQHIGLCQQDEYHSPFEGVTGAKLLINVITSEFLDYAYDLVKEYPELARKKDDNCSPLQAIATMSNTYRSGTRYNSNQSFVYACMPIKELCYKQKVRDIENQKAYKTKFGTKCKSSCLFFGETADEERYKDKFIAKCKSSCFYSVSQMMHLHQDKVKHNTALLLLKSICQEVAKLNKGSDMIGHYHKAFIQAVKNDTPEAVEEILKFFPRAIWERDDQDCTIFQLAILNRCEKVYNFLVHKVTNDVHVHKIAHDKDDNNLLHLAGKLAPPHKLNEVSGAALQMQRELQWFQAVMKFMRPKDKEKENGKKETPMMMFRENHKDLRKDGEDWMKKTADSYTISAALIITIVFAAAITVPGGDDDKTGKPIYSTRPSFILFAISDAISLFTSTTSLLLFLSILTARYRDEDFLYKLPKRLILGLAMLFLSVTSMMVAFSATLYLMFGHEKAWTLIPIATLTCLPVASFVTLQLPLLVDVIFLTYGKGILDEPSDQRSTYHHYKKP